MGETRPEDYKYRIELCNYNIKVIFFSYKIKKPHIAKLLEGYVNMKRTRQLKFSLNFGNVFGKVHASTMTQ